MGPLPPKKWWPKSEDIWVLEGGYPGATSDLRPPPLWENPRYVPVPTAATQRPPKAECTVGWSEKRFFGKNKVSMSQKLPYGTETLYTKFELDL